MEIFPTMSKILYHFILIIFIIKVIPNKVKSMDKKPLFKAPYDLKDVSILFGIVALFLIITALLGNNLFGIFQDSINFGLINNL